MKGILVGLAVVSMSVLAGCNHNDKLVQQAKDAVSAALKDPVSAQWRDVVVNSRVAVANGAEFDVVCGAVNAKNSMGGYVGFRPFKYSRDRADGHDGSGFIDAEALADGEAISIMLETCGGEFASTPTGKKLSAEIVGLR